MGKQVRQVIYLGQESSCGLHGMVRSSVTARERGAAQMSHAIETLLHAAHKDLAAPDRSIVSISSAVEAHAGNSFRPLSAFGKHRGHVCAMVLHCVALIRSKRRSVSR